MARKPDTLPPRNNGKHPGGRPTKRTPDRVRRLAKAIADGLPDEYACALVGITRETLVQWRTDPDFAEFSYTIKAMQAKRLLKRLAVIEAGGQGWQSVCWILERCYAKEFCRPELQFNQNVLVQNTAPPCQQIRLVTVPAADYEKLREKPDYALQPDGSLQRMIGGLRILVSREPDGDNLLADGTLTNGTEH
jgi:hypothetical protein